MPVAGVDEGGGARALSYRVPPFSKTALPACMHACIRSSVCPGGSAAEPNSNEPHRWTRGCELQAQWTSVHTISSMVH